MTAVDVKNRAGHVAGGIRCQQQSAVHALKLPEPPLRYAPSQRLARIAVPEGTVEFRFEKSGANALTPMSKRANSRAKVLVN